MKIQYRSYRSEGTKVNQSDDMVRCIIDIKYIHFRKLDKILTQYQEKINKGEQ